MFERELNFRGLTNQQYWYRMHTLLIGGIFIQKAIRTLVSILALAAVIFACGCVSENGKLEETNVNASVVQNTTPQLSVTGTLENVTGEDSLSQYRMTLEIESIGNATLVSNQAIGMFGPIEMGERAVGEVKEGDVVINPGDAGTVQFVSGNGTAEMLSYCSAERPPAFVMAFMQKDGNETKLLGTAAIEIPPLSEIPPGEKINLKLKTEFKEQ